MDNVYEKPDIEKIEVKQKKRTLSTPEYSESWTGRSCFKICRSKDRKSKSNTSA